MPVYQFTTFKLLQSRHNQQLSQYSMGGGASSNPADQPEDPNNKPPQDNPDNKKDNKSKSPSKTKNNTALKTTKQTSKQPKTAQKKSSVASKKQAKSSQADKPASNSNASKKLNPTCQHGKASQYVCLNNKCSQYPFYSTACQKKCESKHIHNSKVTSVRLKQMQAKLDGYPKVSEILQEQIESYKQTLEKLQQVIEEFVQSQLQKLDNRQIGQKNSPQIQKLIVMFEKQKYAGLTGEYLGKLWRQKKDEPDGESEQVQFINQKEQSMNEFCKCFKQIADVEQGQKKKQPEKKESKQQPTMHFFKRYKLYQDMSLGKEGAWSSKRT